MQYRSNQINTQYGRFYKTNLLLQKLKIELEERTATIARIKET